MLSLNFWNLLFTVINVLVLYLLMKKFLIKPITNIMKQREELINSGLEEARINQEEATKLKEASAKELEEAHIEARDIIVSAKNRANEEKARTVTEAKSEAERLLEKAQEDIKAEKGKAKVEAEEEITQLALLATKKILISGGETADNSSIYDEFLTKAGEMYDTNGN